MYRTKRDRQAAPAGPAVLSGTGALPTLTPMPVPHAPPMGNLLNAGWAPLPGFVSVPEQIGRYRGSLLNQYPANIAGPQLHSVREFGNSHWYYPVAIAIAGGRSATNLQQTQRPANIAGAQRHGSRFSGFISPISAQANAARVTAQQIGQSGLQALSWAARLKPGNAGYPGGS